MPQPPALSTVTALPSERVRLIARLDPGTPLCAGHRLALTLDPAMVHLFDARSGNNLEWSC